MSYSENGSINRVPLLRGEGSGYDLHVVGVSKKGYKEAHETVDINTGIRITTRRPLTALIVAVLLAIAVGCGFMMGGFTLLGNAWGAYSLNASNVAGVVLYFAGLCLALGISGTALTLTALNRTTLTPPATTFLSLMITIGCFVTAYVGTDTIVPDKVAFFTSNYDGLRFFLAMLLITSFTVLGMGGLIVTATIARQHFCSVRHRRFHVGAREKDTEARLANTARPDAFRARYLSFVSLFVVAVAVLLATAVFPACWNSGGGIANYWSAQLPDQVNGLSTASWLAIDSSTVWDFSASAPNVGPGSWNGLLYPKLYSDVVVYFAFLFSLSVLAGIASFLPRIRRFFNIRVPIWHSKHKLLEDLHPWTHGITLGEVFVVTSFVALYGWWTWWWSTGFTYVRSQDAADPHTDVQVAARTLGHLTTLTMSFLLYPVARNSIWEGIFGIPYERALAYHRMLGRICWLLVTAHMFTWQAKWIREGTLLNNVVAVHGLAVSSTDNGSHPANFTIPIAQFGWLVLTISLVIAVVWRRKHYTLFQYTHYAVWLFFLAALIHAWNNWYYMAGGLFLYACDKISRIIRTSREVTLLHIDHGSGFTRLEIDASAFPQGGLRFAGQYAFINIPAISVLEWHPFTISSAPHATWDSEGVAHFHIKDNGPGTWTHKLANLARCKVHPSDLVMALDGPYGNPGRYYEKDSIILVAGGIGITPVHSILADLYGRATDPQKHGELGPIRSVHVVWVFRDRQLPHAFADTFAAILRHNPNDMFQLHLHCTHEGATAVEALTFCDAESAAAVDNIVQTGRPNIKGIFSKVALECVNSQQQSVDYNRLVSTFVCGPTQLRDLVFAEASAYKFDFHTEVFHF